MIVRRIRISTPNLETDVVLSNLCVLKSIGLINTQKVEIFGAKWSSVYINNKEKMPSGPAQP